MVEANYRSLSAARPRSLPRRRPAPRVPITLFYSGEPNHCPCCGGSHWHVGRVSAECVRCGMALVLHTPQQPEGSLS